VNRLLPFVFAIQKILLISSYWTHRLFGRRSRRDSIDWVVGPTETASMVHQIAEAVPRSFSVCFGASTFYAFRYDYMDKPITSKRLRSWHKLLVGPLLLGRLIVEARGFLFVGAAGFLTDLEDQRNFEFRYLKRRGRKLAIYWCGSEIRSPRLMRELEDSMDLPNIFTYVTMLSSKYASDAHERMLRRRAEAADRYADVMFDFPADQKSYLTRHREPFFYLMPEDRFAHRPEKFDDPSPLVITHATTSPIIKGTQLVRAAIAELRSAGYEFEYRELIGLDNSEVLTNLAESHIALNQFFGFTTTVFGVEAMAAQCVLLSSSDGSIETSLPPGQNEAVVVTKHWQLYDNLKRLLDHPEDLRRQAVAGQDWARRYAAAAATGPLLSGILASVLDGSYDEARRSALSAADVYAGDTYSDGLA
jgi:hypothetical protein